MKILRHLTEEHMGYSAIFIIDRANYGYPCIVDYIIAVER